MSENPLEAAQAYFDAWNRHDAAAIVATFAEGGTYSDPLTPGPLAGDAIGAYAQGLWAGFPDVSFDIVSVTPGNSGLVAAEWLMRGTNSGSFNGLPPTGRTVALPGADFIRVESGKIRSVQGYFDAGVVPRALGLDVIVQPKAIGPFQFGVSTRVSSGKTSTPGAFSITWLEARSAEEQQKIGESGRKISQELLGFPGFISMVTANMGDRMLTIGAWESADSMAPLVRQGEHRSAMGRFFGDELSRGGSTSVWIPARINARWIRCTACSKMVNSDNAEGKCGCGAALPEPLAFW